MFGYKKNRFYCSWTPPITTFPTQGFMKQLPAAFVSTVNNGAPRTIILAHSVAYIVHVNSVCYTVPVGPVSVQSSKCIEPGPTQ